MAAKTSWHRYGTKLRHCHMCASWPLTWWCAVERHTAVQAAGARERRHARQSRSLPHLPEQDWTEYATSSDLLNEARPNSRSRSNSRDREEMAYLPVNGITHPRPRTKSCWPRDRLRPKFWPPDRSPDWKSVRDTVKPKSLVSRPKLTPRRSPRGIIVVCDQVSMRR